MIQAVYREFEYPKEFLKIVHLGLMDFDFWYWFREAIDKMIEEGEYDEL